LNESRATRIPWLPIALLLAILPLCFLGFGTDNDSYAVVDCGYGTWHLHQPCTSRNPGYWTYEAVVYVLVQLGGATASNLGSFAMAALVAWRFWRWAERLGVPHYALLAATLIATPPFVIAATATDDYLWSLLLLVLGAEAIVADRFVAATLLSALAIAIRGSNAPLIAGGFLAAIAYESWTHRRLTKRAAKLAATALATAVLAAAAFYPSYRLAENSFAFLRASADLRQLYSGWLRLAKFAYKAQETVGPAAIVVIAIAALVYLRNRRSNPTHAPNDQQLVSLCIGYLLANLLLFLRYPIEYFYLLPALFFFLLLAGATLFAESRRLTLALFVAVLSADLVLPTLVAPNTPGRSTGAHIHFSLQPGLVVSDSAERIKYRDCDNWKCFDQRWHEIHGR
jgi:hypothetical protein